MSSFTVTRNPRSVQIPFCDLRRTTNQNVASGGLGGVVQVNSVTSDNGLATTGTAMADTTNNRIYARRAGIYSVTAQITYDAGTYWKNVDIYWYEGGATARGIATGGKPSDIISGSFVSAAGLANCAVGDYFQMNYYHAKGSNADITAQLRVVWLGVS